MVDRPTEQQVAAWYPRLFRTALRLTGSVQDSADLTQEAFCKAWRNWEQFAGRCSPATWIHGILVNCVRDWFRGRASRPRLAGADFGAWDLPDGSPGAGEALDRQSQMDLLRRSIWALPGELRAPFVAAVLDGRPYQEVAELLAIPVGTVAYRVHRARQQLRSAMQQSSPEDGTWT
jgi:RNA polymerase sigma-70 factor (ECF subfamily)